MPTADSTRTPAPPAPAPDPGGDTCRLQELEILRGAFASFTESTEQLRKSYDTLQARIRQMDLELARKNEELERNLQEKEEVKNYLDFILQSLTTGVIVIDRQGKVTTFNKVAEAITGKTAGVCLGRPLSACLAGHPLARMEGGPAAAGAELMSQEEAVVDGAGQKRILRISAAPARDNVGRVIGTVWLLHDMTRIKRLELEAQRNDRLRAMGGMAAGIAHEIRNPLGSIELFGSLLKRDLQDLPEQKDMAEHILSGIRHLDRIISSLLLFARSPEPSKRRCDVNALIREVLEPPALGPMPENVEVALDLGEGPVLAAGDAELLRQVFTNCIRNAAQAMPGGGKLQVSSRANPAPSKHPDRRRCITVTVADNGMGIPKAKLGNIFHPFFTTKDRGTGLGLAIVHNIIKAHQGTIDVESEEGRGATFILNIPEWEETL